MYGTDLSRFPSTYYVVDVVVYGAVVYGAQEAMPVLNKIVISVESFIVFSMIFKGSKVAMRL